MWDVCVKWQYSKNGQNNEKQKQHGRCHNSLLLFDMDDDRNYHLHMHNNSSY